MYQAGNYGTHDENTPIQIYRHFHLLKLKNFRYKNSDIFHMSAQNIDREYSLEPPLRGGSNEYPQSIFVSRNKKIIYTPVNPSFTIWKWGLRGSTLYRHVFVMSRYDQAGKYGTLIYIKLVNKVLIYMYIKLVIVVCKRISSW